MLTGISKSAYDKAKAYHREEASKLLGCCSLASVVLLDDNKEPCMSDNEVETAFVWLAVSGTVWCKACWINSADIFAL